MSSIDASRPWSCCEANTQMWCSNNSLGLCALRTQVMHGTIMPAVSAILHSCKVTAFVPDAQSYMICECPVHLLQWCQPRHRRAGRQAGNAAAVLFNPGDVLRPEVANAKGLQDLNELAVLLPVHLRSTTEYGHDVGLTASQCLTECGAPCSATHGSRDTFDKKCHLRLSRRHAAASKQ